MIQTGERLIIHFGTSVASYGPSVGAIGILSFASLFVWYRVIHSLAAGDAPVAYQGERASAPSWIVALIVGWFACILLAAAFVPRQDIAADAIGPLGVLLDLALAAVLWGTVVKTTPTPDGWGWRHDRLGQQVLIGAGAAAAALLPTFVLGLLAEGMGDEQQVVQLLRESHSLRVWGALGTSAVVGAPLLEEAIFRIVIQGYLTTRMRAEPAIAWTAMLFAAVHGWPAMVGLMPFALIIGYVYHQTRSAVSVVVMHMLFNASMLSLVALQTLEG